MTARRLLPWLVALCAPLAGGDALADGVAQILTAKSIPPATVAVIDPESGSSGGGGTTDVLIGPGDIILFRFEYFPVPDGQIRGLQGYLTEYVPDNTEVVGVRILDPATDLTIEPRWPGIANDGCARPCDGYDAVPCSTGTCNLDDGSISQVYADTGIFYAADTLLLRDPGTAFITLVNGIEMTTEPTAVAPSIKSILGVSSPIYAHDAWDWIQARSYGISGGASGNGGTGNTPFDYGSPVAGPQTHYSNEAAEVSPGVIQFNGDVGPWNRILYPGSQIGSGSPVTSGGSMQRMNVDATGASAGLDLTPNAPLPASTTAVRIAMGEVRVGEPGLAEIALRVVATPLDSVQAADVDCVEIFGGDTSAKSSSVRARDNAWTTFLPSPNCVFLNLKFDLEVDDPLSFVGDTTTYTLSGKNLSLLPQTSVVVMEKYDSTRQTLVGCTGGATTCASCAAACGGDGDAAYTCLVWPTMTLAPSDEYVFDCTYTTGGGGHVTNPVFGVYRSDAIPSPGFTTQAISLAKAVPVVRATLSAPSTATAPGGTVALSGAISNDGSADSTYNTLTILLPAGFAVSGGVTLGASTLSCSSGCAGNTPTYDVSSSFTPGDSRALSFSALVAGGAATGLYDVDLQIWASVAAFGGEFETYFSDAATVAVGAPRSDPPVLTCPISSGATTITGTTTEAAGTTIRLYFSLLERASALTAGPSWSVGGYTGTFGAIYGGLEVRATAQAAGELESPLSAACVVTSVPVCSDFTDNDGDGLVDFPADPGCSSPTDGSESPDPVYECADGLDNDTDTFTDWPADASCWGPLDESETGPPQCSDGVDSDGDGLVDLADPGCSGPLDGSEISYDACMDGVDNDGDGTIDFGDDSGCHSLNDDSEATPPAAMEILARLLLLFDTSGSMNWSTCNSTFTGGDGSISCPGSDVTCATCSSATCGNAMADDARLFKVKTGISDAVAAFGEIEWGLMRFHQRPIPFACPTSNASLGSGGWQGGGAAPCSGGFSAGDLLVSFSTDNPDDLIEWIDQGTNYPGTPPPGLDFELRGSGTTPLGGSLDSALDYLTGATAVDPAASCRPYVVVLVTDGAETCGGDPVGAAGALAVAGFPVHVIGFSTTDAATIALLDSIAFAGGTTSAIFADDEVALSTAIADIVTDSILVELCNFADDDCDTLVDEDFPDLGDACGNGMLGECLVTGTRVCAPGGLGTTCDAPPGTPGTEVCNGLDDDCDGLIDDGISCTPCVPGTEVCNGLDDDCDCPGDTNGDACVCCLGDTDVDEAPLPGAGGPCDGADADFCPEGSIVCTGGSFSCSDTTGDNGEICNGLDDDCNGIIDDGFGLGGACDGPDSDLCPEGILSCDGSGGTTCSDATGDDVETCNGDDDDCDGVVDEDWPDLGTACDNGLVAPCTTTGVWTCLADGSGTYCTAPTVVPGAESCNGLDDDCDGAVDEDIGAPIGDACGGGSGCEPGEFRCVDGEIECCASDVLTSCEAPAGGGTEVCNGADDDCDFLIDEEPPPLPGVGEECTDPGFEDVGETGECVFGETECIGGELTCIGYLGPTTEVCDGLDNDCDGEPDDGAQCPEEGQVCHDGRCVEPCSKSEFPCPEGFVCEGRGDDPGDFQSDVIPGGDYCVPNPCVMEKIDCPDGFLCDPETGDCIDLCEGIVCKEGQTCLNSFCLDCFTLGCDGCATCVANDEAIGVCVADPCVVQDGDACVPLCPGKDEFCRDGECVSLACDPACPEDEICVDGSCRPSPCAGVTCDESEMCRPEDGACVENPCNGVTCIDGEACVPATGDCAPDPCAVTTCPSGFVCEIRWDGSSDCAPGPPPPGYDVLATGAGGCACSMGLRPRDRERP